MTPCLCRATDTMHDTMLVQGYYPKKKKHKNQDCFAIHRLHCPKAPSCMSCVSGSALNGDPNIHLLSIFDGHG